MKRLYASPGSFPIARRYPVRSVCLCRAAHGGIELSTQIRLTIDDISQLVLVFRRSGDAIRRRTNCGSWSRIGCAKKSSIAKRWRSASTRRTRSCGAEWRRNYDSSSRMPRVRRREELETWYERNRSGSRCCRTSAFAIFIFPRPCGGNRARDDAAAALTKSPLGPGLSLAANLRRCFHVSGVLPRPRIGFLGKEVRSEFCACR